MVVVRVAVVMAAAELVVNKVLVELPEQLTQVVVLVAVASQAPEVALVVQALLFYVTQAHKEAQAVLLHQLAALPTIRLQLLAHTRLKEEYVTFC
jgi:hypothetical protein